MVEDLTFANGLKSYLRETNTSVEVLAGFFRVSERTLHYWHTGNRYPNPTNLWWLRDIPNRPLRDIIRVELDRQLPGVWK